MIRSIKFENYDEVKAKGTLQFLAVQYGKAILDTLNEIQVSYAANPGVTFTFNGNVPEMLNQASTVQRDLGKLGTLTQAAGKK